MTFDLKKQETFLAKGKRGHVYLTTWKRRKAVVKRLSPASPSPGALKHEAMFLEKANALGIGPKLYSAQNDGIVMEYVEGERILNFFKDPSHSSQDIVQICKAILLQCHTLDRNAINKMELTNPYKHIIIRRKGKEWEPVMIDFERCHMTKKPKNVTQFLQFLTSGVAKHAFGGKISFDKDIFWALAREYKNGQDDAAFSRILQQVSSHRI